MTTDSANSERERLSGLIGNLRQGIVHTRVFNAAADELESLIAELTTLRSSLSRKDEEIEGLRAQLNAANWRADAVHIHQTVVKAWPAWGDEDKRFLALAMSGEVGELLNLIKKDWRGDAGNRSKAIAEEMVDVRIYLQLLATAYGVDLDRACNGKIPELYRRWPEAAQAEGRQE